MDRDSIARAILESRNTCTCGDVTYVNLPSPQTAGTLTQGASYAKHCADKALALEPVNGTVDYSQVYA